MAMALLSGLCLIASAVAAPGDVPGRGFLPDGRGWEMVSPPDKNDSDVIFDTATARGAVSGAAVTYQSAGAFAGTPGGPKFSAYLSRRRADGWHTVSITPAQAAPDAIGILADPFGYGGFSDDLTRGVLFTGEPAQVPGAPAGIRSLYRRNLDDGSHDLLTPTGPSGFSAVTYTPYFAGASRDFRHVIFESSYPLTPDSPVGVAANLYEWFDGSLRLAGVLPDGTPASGGSTAGSGFGAIFNAFSTKNYNPNAVSSDGSRIVFTADPDSNGLGQLYVREDATSTKHASRSRRTDCAVDPEGCTGVPAPDPDGPSLATFWGASDDGRWVFFTSTEKLTDDASACLACNDGGPAADLYRFDVETDELLNVSEATTSSATEVQGVLGVGADGRRVYFVAGDTGSGGTGGLYLWDDGELTRIAASPGMATWSRQYSSVFRKQSRMTPDGRYLLVASGETLTDDVTAGTVQIYRYDAVTEELVCASCLPAPAPSTGDSTFAVGQGGATATQRAYLPRAISDDGRRVFFETAQGLVPEDSNGVVDVYMWADGGAHLISSGRSQDDAHFLDASATGDDVFFVARDRLVGADTDANLDVYNARVGGGFPEPGSGLAPCQGDRCQGRSNSASPASVPGSILLRGSDRSPDRGRALLAVRGVGRLGLARLARGGRATLTARVSRPGTLRVVGRATIAGRKRVVLRASRATRRAGKVQVALRLSPAARRDLDRRSKLEVVLRVGFTGAEGRAMRLGLASADRAGR